MPIPSNTGNNYTGLDFTSPFLSPPTEYPCRRANSDSAIHSLVIPVTVPDSSEESSNNSNGSHTYGSHNAGIFVNESPNGVPNTVGEGQPFLEIPLSVSTGSLPDLTNMQFNAPLHQPLDQDETQLINSPYSTVLHDYIVYLSVYSTTVHKRAISAKYDFKGSFAV